MLGVSGNIIYGSFEKFLLKHLLCRATLMKMQAVVVQWCWRHAPPSSFFLGTFRNFQSKFSFCFCRILSDDNVKSNFLGKNKKPSGFYEAFYGVNLVNSLCSFYLRWRVLWKFLFSISWSEVIWAGSVKSCRSYQVWPVTSNTLTSNYFCTIKSFPRADTKRHKGLEVLENTQPAITCSKLTIKAPERAGKCRLGITSKNKQHRNV